MKRRRAWLLGSAAFAVFLTGYDWWRYQGGVRGFTSWPAQAFLAAVWPSNWFVATDSLLYRWAILIFWVSNITVWTAVGVGATWLALRIHRMPQGPMLNSP